jgi:hypothetical protein
MRSYGGVVLLLIVSGLLLCSGCGPSTNRRPLSGTVTYQGKPLELGVITFLTTSGPSGPVCGARISAGRFEVPVLQGLEPGTYRVAISAAGPPASPTPEEIAAGASPRAQELIPPQYNEESKLTAEVKADGPNQLDFNLP